MWLFTVVPFLVLTALGIESFGGLHDPQQEQPTSEMIATRQTLFAIPFTVDRPEHASQEPGEVQLFVSPDRGANWQLYGRANPAQQRFMFRAGNDGEYWFQVRTLDRNGRPAEESTGTPGLRVVVDTTPPKLQLTARQGQAGQITAAWQIDEPYLKADSLAIQYRTVSNGPWQTVAVGRENWRQTSETIRYGEVTWWSQSSNSEVQIRAEVTDTAGNQAVSHAQVGLGRVAEVQKPIMGNEKTPTAWRAGTEPPPVHWPAQETNEQHLMNSPPAAAVVGNVNPPISSRYVAPHEQITTVTSPVQAQNDLPPGERPQMVNSRRFELQYEIDSVGPSGIERVELWGTQDGGQTWRSFAVDDDGRSPLPVAVQHEGVYGFRVVVTTGDGLGGRPPQQDTMPEIFIGVDLTKPTARITSVEQGTGEESGKLVVSWDAADRCLAARPVSLAFSQNPAGPWTTVAAGLENTGRYAWTLDGRLPEQIYLRLEVRDEAGNIGAFQTAESVSLDLRRPRVHIRSVRPLDQTRVSPKRYYFR